jgi:hypothetical protein
LRETYEVSDTEINAHAAAVVRVFTAAVAAQDYR